MGFINFMCGNKIFIDIFDSLYVAMNCFSDFINAWSYSHMKLI